MSPGTWYETVLITQPQCPGDRPQSIKPCRRCAADAGREGCKPSATPGLASAGLVRPTYRIVGAGDSNPPLASRVKSALIKLVRYEIRSSLPGHIQSANFGGRLTMRRVWPQPVWSGQVWRRHAASQKRYSYRVLAWNTVSMRARSASLASLPSRSTNSRSHAVNSLYSGAL